MVQCGYVCVGVGLEPKLGIKIVTAASKQADKGGGISFFMNPSASFPPVPRPRLDPCITISMIRSVTGDRGEGLGWVYVVVTEYMYGDIGRKRRKMEQGAFLQHYKVLRNHHWSLLLQLGVCGERGIGMHP